MTVKPIPDGYHSLTPALKIKDAAKLIDFLKQVFEAEEIERYSGADNVVMHAEIRIGDSILMMGDAAGEAPMPGSFYLYVNDVDATYKRALSAGATSLTEPADQFYGSRVARVRDDFGNLWAIATHQEDVSSEEVKRRFEALMETHVAV